MKLAIDGGTPVRAEFLSYARPKIEEAAIAEAVEAMRSGWLTTGPRVKKFEEKFAVYCGIPYGVAVNSCTAALHLALLAAGVGPGDEVITTPMTFVATAEAIQYCGATPVLADVDPRYLNLDPACVAEKITVKTKAIVPVHFAGTACPMDELLALARQHNLKVVADAAHASETQYRGKNVAHYGDFVCYSFYATKNLPMGEGGLVATRDEAGANLVRELRLHGMNAQAWKRYSSKGFTLSEVVRQGYKYNLTDVAAALGLHHLAVLEQNLIYRTRLVERYRAGLADLPEVATLPVPDYCRPAYHLFAIRFALDRLRVDRNQLASALQEENIGVSVHFHALPLHPFYREQYG
ncbi:MAG TPA: DegT/DnrJ/EryC1/StrS family aminotransferase, partial [bacterium]|nr:DegT/DnrJ/EryC1/StrS family aminotransferase [bacterium]